MFVDRHQVLCTGDVTIYIYMYKLLLPMKFYMANIVLYILSVITIRPQEIE